MVEITKSKNLNIILNIPKNDIDRSKQIVKYKCVIYKNSKLHLRLFVL